MQKVPYQLVVGDKEVNEGLVTYREYGKQEQITVKLDEFVKLIVEKCEKHK